jgi:hypothetical protein
VVEVCIVVTQLPPDNESGPHSILLNKSLSTVCGVSKALRLLQQGLVVVLHMPVSEALFRLGDGLTIEKHISKVTELDVYIHHCVEAAQTKMDPSYNVS